MHSLSYTTSGAGEHAIVFLHGLMGNAGDWEEVMGELDGRFRCVAVDLPGHGESLGLPEEDYAMEGAANALLRMLGGLGVERASLVGYSMGGRLALYFALRFPERCERVFLESASPGLKTEEERAARRKADEEKAKRLESGADFDAFLEEWHAQPLFSSLSRHEGLVEKLIEHRKGNDPSELAKSLRGMGTGSQPSLWNELENLRVPTLAVAGGLDAKFAGISREMSGLSPNIESVIVRGVGHNAHVEEPGEFAGLLTSYLCRGGYLSRWMRLK